MKINFVKRFCLAFVFASLAMLCHAEEIGLVLSGGGGKGAYEVGVWKALCEYGIAQKVTVISGTSVGGLNAALFACVKADKAEKIWVDIVPSRLTQDGALISQEGLNKIISSIPLQKLNKGYRPHVFVTTVRAKGKIIKRFTSKPGSDAFRFLLNEEPDFEQIRLKLLATSAFPVLTDPITPEDLIIYRKNKGSGRDLAMVLARLFVAISLIFTVPGYYFPLRLSVMNSFTGGKLTNTFNILFTFISIFVCAIISAVYDKILNYLTLEISISIIFVSKM